MKKLWDKLAIYALLVACSCGNCTSALTTKLVSDRDEEHIHRFLMGLEDEEFETVRSSITSQESLPPFA